MGCEYGCEYCYSRDEKYNPHRPSRDPEVLRFDDAFSQYIKVKDNAPELLRKALRNLPRDLIYLDSYQPVDQEFQYVRKMLEVCLELGYPVFINEKSPMLLRDLDILEKISKKSYLNVCWSIITAKDDESKKVFEPKAPAISARFGAMAQLAGKGIMTGVALMPILPFIHDSEENVRGIIEKTKECGGQYVLDAGLTLWGYCRTHFYKSLERYDPGLVTRYDELYGDPKSLTEHTRNVHQLVLENSKKYELTPWIPRPVHIYPKELQVNKKIAEKFYLEARELQLSGQGDHREWAYRKAAWSLDDLEVGVDEIFRKRGIDGIMEIKGIGETLSRQIEEFLSSDERDQ